MRDESDKLLDSLLEEWHRWASGWSGVSQPKTCAMFNAARSSRQWDAEHDLIDGQLHNAQMSALDFHVTQLPDQFRTAIQLLARNLVAKVAVWTSPRLPQDPQERAVVLMEARNALMRRLFDAGVL